MRKEAIGFGHCSQGVTRGSRLECVKRPLHAGCTPPEIANHVEESALKLTELEMGTNA